MNRMDYGQSVVTIRVLEKRLLTRNRLERMIEAQTPEEVLKLLGETEYFQNMADIHNSQDYETILKRETERIFSIVRSMVKNTAIVDILSLKYDYHNLKVLLKSKITGKDFSNLLMRAGTIDAGAVHLTTPSPVRKTLVFLQPLSVKPICAPGAISVKATKAKTSGSSDWKATKAISPAENVAQSFGGTGGVPEISLFPK